MSRTPTDAELAWLDELGNESPQVRHYRLTAAHALLLPVIGLGAIIIPSFVGGLVGLLMYGVANGFGIFPNWTAIPVANSEVEDVTDWEDAPSVEALESDAREPKASASFDEDALNNELAAAAERYRKAHTTPAERSQKEQAEATERLRNLQAAAEEQLRKEQATKKISEAFIALKNNPSKARAFIRQYKGNLDAEESGFVAAAWRIINERMIYSASNVTKCGDCWCLVEPPLLVSDNSPSH